MVSSGKIVVTVAPLPTTCPGAGLSSKPSVISDRGGQGFLGRIRRADVLGKKALNRPERSCSWEGNCRCPPLPFLKLGP